LELQGDYVVKEIVTNAEWLQKRWALDHNVSFSSKGWASDILIAQINEFKPDVIFAQDHDLMTYEFRKKIKKSCTNIKLTIGWDGVALNNAERYEGMDIMLSCVDHIVEYYKQHGFSSYLLPFGFEATLLDEISCPVNHYDVTFVGGLSLSEGGHYQRLFLLIQLLNNLNIDLWLSSNFLRQTIKSTLYFFKQAKIRKLYNHIKTLSDYYSLLNHSKETVFGLEMYKVLATSKIVINSHLDAARNQAGNMRLFEATGVGACLVTDWKENLADYFEPEKEVVIYRTPEECIEKIKWLLSHPTERETIAKAGQKRCLKDHSFMNRASRLDKIIKQKLTFE